MNSKANTHRLVTVCLSLLVLSSLALASTGKIIGELTINVLNDKPAEVTVNSVLAQSGQTVLLPNTITTNADAGARLSLGKLGSVNIAPNTVVNFSAADTGMTAELTAGEITAYSDSLSVKTVDGTIITPKFGETVSSAGVVRSDDGKGKDEKDADGTCRDTNRDGKAECDGFSFIGLYFWLAVAAGGGVTAYVVSRGRQVQSIVISPNR